MPAQTVIKLRRDAAADWVSADPTLAEGELGIETDTNRIKIGDGVTEWTGLAYGPVSDNAVIKVKNSSGSVAIPAGRLVQFAGAVGDTVTVAPAVTDGSIDFHYLVGVTSAEIPADDFGDVVLTGVVSGLDTSAYNVGTLLYADPSNAGQLTSALPVAPAFGEPVAAVTRSGAGTSGLILVRLHIGASLNDIHDVTLSSVASGQVLQFDGTKWVNAAIDLSGYATQSFVNTAVANLVDSAPETLDTLNELAAALGDDPNFATTVTNALGNKSDVGHTHLLADITDITATATELNYVDGVTSSVQTQLDAKAEALPDLSDVTLTTPASGEVLSYNGTGWVNAAPAGGSASVSTKSADYTLAAVDAGNIISFTTSAYATVPAATFSTGDQVQIINFTNTPVRVTAGTGATVYSSDGVTLESWGRAVLTFLSASAATLNGDVWTGITKPVAGYMSQGENGTSVYKWAFPTDAVSTTTSSPAYPYSHAGFANPAVAGYMSQGDDGTSVYKWAFPTDAVSTTTSSPAGMKEHAGFANPAVAGYFSQGVRSTPVYKWAFPTDAVSTTTSAPAGMKQHAGFANPAVAGYFSQGDFETAVYKWAFPTDAVSTTTSLPAGIYSHAGFANPAVAGYFSRNDASTVYKWAFPTDAVSTTTSAPAMMSLHAGFANPAVAGYFSRGSVGGWPYISVYKWAFPTDAVSTTTSSPAGMYSHAGFAL